MTIHVGITKAKATLSYLISRAVAGDEVVITRRGKPVARLVAIDALKASASV